MGVACCSAPLEGFDSRPGAGDVPTCFGGVDPVLARIAARSFTPKPLPLPRGEADGGESLTPVGGGGGGDTAAFPPLGTLIAGGVFEIRGDGVVIVATGRASYPANGAREGLAVVVALAVPPPWTGFGCKAAPFLDSCLRPPGFGVILLFFCGDCCRGLGRPVRRVLLLDHAIRAEASSRQSLSSPRETIAPNQVIVEQRVVNH